MMGWTAVVFAIQSWLNESPAQVAAGKQPAYFAVAMSLMSLLIVRRQPYYTRPTALPNFPSSMESRADRHRPTCPSSFRRRIRLALRRRRRRLRKRVVANIGSKGGM